MATNRLTPFCRPAEWVKHARTIMAWPGVKDPAYQQDPSSLTRSTNDVCAIAEAVARFEPVTMLVGRERLSEAQKRFSFAPSGRHPIRVHVVAGDQLNLWMRDIAPTFTLGRDDDDSQKNVLHGVVFNFNGWGNRHNTKTCATLARTYLREVETPEMASSIVTEGGALELDGEGTLMASESSLVNENRNPGMTREQIEHELGRVLGVTKFIWIPGLKNGDSTDFHIDAYARFARPGVVFVSSCSEGESGAWAKAYRDARAVLEKATDAKGRRLQLIEIPEPRMDRLNIDEETRRAIREKYLYRPIHSYVNFLIVNGGVILPQFGDEERDRKAREVAESVFGGDRVVLPVLIEELPLLGGGIHCSTQEVPLVEG